MAADFRACANFVDDVRYEIDGKLTIIGTYDNGMQLQDQEKVEGCKLHAVIRIFGPYNAEIDAPVIHILLNGDDIAAYELNSVQCTAFKTQRSVFISDFGSLFDKYSRQNDMGAVLAVAPIMLPALSETGLLSIEVDMGFGRLPAGTIVVIV